MQKTGMKYEGPFKEHARKWGDFEDVVYRGILNPERKQT
jgi:hypothetical protein